MVLRNILAASLLLGVCSTTAIAQTVPASSEAGRIETRFDQTPQARAQASPTRGLESTMAPAQAAQIFLLLENLTVEGSTVYGSDELQAFTTELIGKRISLAQVFEVTSKITAQYGKDGYLLSRVIVPPQEIDQKNANIQLRVIEGYIDEVVWPDGLDRYRNFFDNYATKITAQRPIKAQHLERYLLLASDLPGLKFRSNMKASANNPMASTLHLTVENDPHDLSVSVDNRGSDASGPYQATLSGGLNNPLGFHERWSGGYTTAGPSTGTARPELHYVFWGYDQTLNAEGLKFSFTGNASWGDPGSAALSALDYETEGLNWSTSLSMPFIRTRAENLTGTIAFDFKNSESTNTGGIASHDRLRIFRGELAYDKADEQNGTNQLILSVSQGIEGFGSSQNGDANLSRSPGKVDFFKTTLFGSRTQTLKNNFSLYGSIFGQWSPDPLLSSQECGYGGQQFGRGFDASIVTGDQCVQASAELRYNAPLKGKARQALDYSQFYGFVDYGKTWNIDAPLGTPEQDRAASAGVGVRFGKDIWNADISFTKILTAPNSNPGLDEWRVWARIGARY